MNKTGVETQLTRRRILQVTVGGSVAIPLSALLGAGSARAQNLELPKLAIDDPMAKSLAYIEDASSVDAATQPAYKEGSTCANCQLYTGGSDSEWGPCGIFPGKLVKAEGWCRTWVKKAA
ncbi:MAG: high-potential iron-sulfur protein [Pseudomonadota bacterium]